MINVIQDPWLRRGSGMDAIGLKHLVVVGEALEHEGNQRNILLSRNLCEQAFETPCIHRAVVGGNTHSGDHDFCAVLAAGLHNRDKIAPGFFKGIAAQAVIAAKRNHDYSGSMFLKSACNAIAAAERGFTADTGVYHLVIELVTLDALLE